MARARLPMGPQTRLAIANFPVSGLRFPRVFIEALGRIKQAGARINGDLGTLPKALARALAAAAGEVAEGRHDDAFVVDVFQTGSGTSTNMNANEVIALLASRHLGRAVHPNDHVNLGQSSNDVIPSAVHVAALLAMKRDLLPALEILRASLSGASRRFDRVVKLGRTHLMDAVPIRLGQEFSGYAAQVAAAREHLRRSSESLRELPLGGTAVGTGINAPPGFGRRVIALLARETSLPLRPARNPFEAQGARDGLVRLSGALRALATALVKIANDIRWMGSGPAGGLGELILPALQPGSSIMPGKTNPVICEVVVQVGAQVVGNDAAVALGGQGGAFELNAMVPVMAHNLLQSIALLASAARLFAAKCVDGLRADARRCRDLAERSPALATVLAPRVGYDRAAALVEEAMRRGMTIRDLAVEKGWVTASEARRLFDPLRLTRRPR
ncbi:MAG TPA: class II fumarate hydratase [Planctomycetota bacterium]|nr:class II fumarate hydratase [Planctomycetota bacterium]